jgi:hypothetical protein
MVKVPTLRSIWVPLLLLLTLAACGGGGDSGGGSNGGGTGGTPNPTPNPTPTPPAPTPPAGVPQVKAGDPIYWDQGANSLGEVQDYRYVLYVAGQPLDLTGHRCANTSTRGVFLCNASLPASLPAGLVALAITAVRSLNGTTYESPRSATLEVWVLTGAAAASAANTVTVLRVPGSAAEAEDAAATAAIVDLAALPDGRLLSVDVNGLVGLVEDGRVAATALEPATGGAAQIVSLSASADFERSRLVFAVEAADDRGAEVWDVTRYREMEGTLGERAVIVPAVATRVGTRARLRIGPDGLAYLAAFDAGTATAASRNVSLYRFGTDGAVPSGQSSRLLRAGAPGGLAFDWHPGTGEPWLGGPDVAAGAFVGGSAPGLRLAALVVARTDGTIERRVVSAGNFERIVRISVVKVDTPGDATALVRTADGAIRAAISSQDAAPAVRVLDAQ